MNQSDQWHRLGIIAGGVGLVGARARRCLGRGQHSELGPKKFNPVVAQDHLAGRVGSRNRLMAQVWDEKRFDSTMTLDVPRAALRPRIEAAEQRIVCDEASGRISTLRGLGYSLEVSRGATAKP